MKKNLLWMLAAIFFCGLTVTLLTACSDDDNTGTLPTDKLSEKIRGEWLTVVNRNMYDEDEDETSVEYVLLTFGEDGVMNQNVYIGDTQEPIKHWERMCRHGLYSIDEALQTFAFEIGSTDIATVPYRLDNDQLLLTYVVEREEPYEMTLTFHRPSKAEKDLINMYNISLWGDDYVGKWFSVQEEDGKQTYVMLDFTENSKLNTIRYTVENGNVTRTSDSQFVSDVYDAEDDEPVFEIYSSTDYNQKDTYYWDVTSNILTLELINDEEEEEYYIYHALTKADIAKIAELDEKVIANK